MSTPRVGLEPTTHDSQVLVAQGLTNAITSGWTKYGTKRSAESRFDLGLDDVAAAWPDLPEHVRQTILTLIESVRKSDRAT